MMVDAMGIARLLDSQQGENLGALGSLRPFVLPPHAPGLSHGPGSTLS